MTVPRGNRVFLNVLSAVSATVLMLTGCATDGVPTSTAPNATRPGESKIVPSTNVSRVQAFKDAEMVASLDTGRSSAVGAGGSMQPIFGENTMLVINKIAYEDLAEGMTVAYVNRLGHRVVHQLITKDVLGWRIQGFNNEVEDRERVTRDNLLGVVYASFAAGVEP